MIHQFKQFYFAFTKKFVYPNIDIVQFLYSQYISEVILMLLSWYELVYSHTYFHVLRGPWQDVAKQ